MQKFVNVFLFFRIEEKNARLPRKKSRESRYRTVPITGWLFTKECADSQLAARWRPSSASATLSVRRNVARPMQNLEYSLALCIP